MPTKNSILPLTSKTTPDTTKVQNNLESENISPTNTPADGNVRVGVEPQMMHRGKTTVFKKLLTVEEVKRKLK
jgi:hypothetical protein